MGNGAATNVSTRAHPRLYLQPAFSRLSSRATPPASAERDVAARSTLFYVSQIFPSTERARLKSKCDCSQNVNNRGAVASPGNPKPLEIQRRAGSVGRLVASRRDTFRVHKSVNAARRSASQECVRHEGVRDFGGLKH
jgi:hypothetical protein